MTARLPTVGSDSDTWGTVLNGFLSVSLASDGTLKNTALNAKAWGVTGDGTTDDTAAINALLAASSDVNIYFPQGTYLVSAPLIKTSGTLILNAENATIKIVPAFPAGAGGNLTGVFKLSNLTRFRMAGVVFDGNRANLTHAGSDWTNFIIAFYITSSSNISIERCQFLNCPSIVIDIATSSLIQIRDCVMQNNMYHSVYLDNCTYAVIDNNHVTGLGNQGTNTSIGGVSLVASVGHHIIFSNNYLEQNPDTGMKTEGTNDVIFEGNYVSQSGKDGIKFQNLVGDGVHTDVPIVYRCKIVNNTVNQILAWRSDGSAEIQVLSAQDVIVSGNNVIGGGKTTAIEVGILAWSGSSDAASKNITIANNNIINAQIFIQVEKVDGAVVQGNICENEVLPIVASSNGVQVNSSSNFKITDNKFKRFSTASANYYGLFLFNSGNFTVQNNSFINMHNGIGGSFISSNTIEISHNTFDNTAGYFGSLAISGTGQTITNFIFKDNSLTNIADDGWLFQFDPTGSTIQYIDFTHNKVSGGSFNPPISVLTGGTVNKIDISGTVISGNISAMSLAALPGVKTIVGLRATALPASGTWARGDLVYNSTPSASGFLGWVCVTAGSPGTWKGFGTIQT